MIGRPKAIRIRIVVATVIASLTLPAYPQGFGKGAGVAIRPSIGEPTRR
jgi:hypothetical protein